MNASPSQKTLVTESEADRPIVESWYDQARNLGPHDSLDSFISDIVSKHNFDYGTCVHLVTATVMAAMANMCKGLGLTGFQHDCVMHELLRREFSLGQKIGYRIQNLDDIIYPQYVEKLTTIHISASAAERIKNEAQARLDEYDPETSLTCSNVVEHWKRLASGWLPQGIVVD